MLDTIKEYHDEVGEEPRPELLAVLLEFPVMPVERASDARYDEARLENAICRSALQIVASTLADQRVHREKALGELQTQQRQSEELRKRRRRRRAAPKSRAKK